MTKRTFMHCELFISVVPELDFQEQSRAELDIYRAKLAALWEWTENVLEFFLKTKS